MSQTELLPCPFCGWQPPADLSDVLYPSGTYRRVDERHGFAHYVSMNQSKAGDTPCWDMHCTTNMGGCGAQISADSEAEAIAAWNRRPSVIQPTGGKTDEDGVKGTVNDQPEKTK